MGHAGAIISGGSGTAAEKVAAFNKVGIKVAESPAEIAILMKKELEKRKSKPKVKKVLAKKKKAVKKVKGQRRKRK
jgi:succinyl-CoA synthetase alpha subunit